MTCVAVAALILVFIFETLKQQIQRFLCVEAVRAQMDRHVDIHAILICASNHAIAVLGNEQRRQWDVDTTP